MIIQQLTSNKSNKVHIDVASKSSYQPHKFHRLEHVFYTTPILSTYEFNSPLHAHISAVVTKWKNYLAATENYSYQSASLAMCILNELDKMKDRNQLREGYLSNLAHKKALTQDSQENSCEKTFTADFSISEERKIAFDSDLEEIHEKPIFDDVYVKLITNNLAEPLVVAIYKHCQPSESNPSSTHISYILKNPFLFDASHAKGSATACVASIAFEAFSLYHERAYILAHSLDSSRSFFGSCYFVARDGRSFSLKKSYLKLFLKKVSIPKEINVMRVQERIKAMKQEEVVVRKKSFITRFLCCKIPKV